MTDLFGSFDLASSADTSEDPTIDLPLAERLRPTCLDDVIGQEHITGPNGPLGRMIAAKRLSSVVFWGPPGTGKTTIARLLADATGLRFKAISAVTTNVAELKTVFAEARALAQNGKRTALFIDEVHRLTKATQDQLLEPLERGYVVLIGATTEHPAYELNNAIQSRSSVLILKALDRDALEKLLIRAETLIERTLPLTSDARQSLLTMAQGDGRFLLNQAEALLAMNLDQSLDVDGVSEAIGTRLPNSDKDRDYHYDLVSAFQKSIRGSDPDAALYWFARMLEGGEDMKFILRRLIVMASEEVAVADPQALVQCIAARDAYEMLGSPQGDYAVAQAIVYVATSPKSNAVYEAYHAARELAKKSSGLYPPERIINHPTAALARQRGYKYDHDFPGAFSGQNFWPDALGPRMLYQPNERGFENHIAKRLQHWNSLRDTPENSNVKGAET